MTHHQRRTAVLFLPIVLLLAAADASAQDKGDIGITMGYPAAVGFVFHISDRLAIRPELNLNKLTAESDSQFGASSSESFSVGAGVSALFYLPPTDKLRPYVAPRYLFNRSKNSSDSSVGSNESTSKSHTVGASFGAQYSLHDRFSLYGEVGVSHSFDFRNTPVGPGLGELQSETRVSGIRSGVGVIFYF